MDNQDNITISKYINGDLKGEELIAFEKLLQQDKALYDEVNFHKIVDETLAENYQAIQKIDEGERLEFEGILSKVMDGEKVDKERRSDLSEEVGASSSGLIRKLFPLTALAAAAAVLFFIFSSPNLSKLANQNYSAYKLQLSEPKLGSNIQEGIQAYQNKDYETALNIFNQTKSGDLKLHLAKGNAEYNLEKYDDAIKTFNQVKEKTGNQNYKNYANWYLALTHLKKGDKSQAMNLLETLPESADFYNQAQNLLKKLE